MIPLKLPTNGSQITVTDTASTLEALIQATTGNAGYKIPGRFNSVILNAEDGDIRWSLGETPTTNLGMELVDGQSVSLTQTDLGKVLLIRDGAANVKVNITIYESNTLN